MSDFQRVSGFEEALRPPVAPSRPRISEPALRGAHGPSSAGAGSLTPAQKARLIRVAWRAPEVMVKITGRTRDEAHLRSHLEYISRNGKLPLEAADGTQVIGRREVGELADDWAAESRLHAGRRDGSMSVSVVLSMPPGTDAFRTRDAVAAFARESFGETFDYVFALHTDAKHPHVHLSVRSLGASGERLNPRKADLELWRQTFARSLRERGIAAEATPRRARGITRKSERTPVRKMRERHAEGRGPLPRVLHQAYREAVPAASGVARAPEPWAERVAARQAQVRALYLAEAKRLGASGDPQDRRLGLQLEQFVKSMPPVQTRAEVLAHELQTKLKAAQERAAPAEDGRGRAREGEKPGKNRTPPGR